MSLQLDYGSIKREAKQAALRPYLRLVVFLITFLTLFAAVLIKDNALPTLASPSGGPSGHRAWEDLRAITRQPHPWNSRENDRVRAYVLSEMKKAATEYEDVIVIDDQVSTVLDDRKDLITRLSGDDNITVTYFEGLNVLVRIPGTSRMSGAILLSAHIDSVSTAPGATDDGMGAASAMELVRYFAQHRTKRDIIVNLNDGEEDFLWGAKAFANHPWAREVVAFVNLEGAGAGGRSILFRTSNAVVARAYAGTPYPFVSQLANDFFKSGLIRSETDYVVYEDMNHDLTPGLDIAFFKPRSLYHTGLDDIRHTSQGSLQHMLSAGLTSVRNLADDAGKKTFAYGGPAVYFDFLGGTFAEIKLGVLWIWNLVLLLLCPWILGFAFVGRIKATGKVLLQGFGVAGGSVVGGFIIVPIFMAILSQTSWPMAYAHPTMLAGFAILMAFTTLYLITRLNYVLRPAIRKNPNDAERVITWELCVIWYIFLFISAIVSVVHKVGFVFFIPISFFGTFLAALTTLFEPSSFAEPLFVSGDESTDTNGIDERAPLLRGGDLEDDRPGSVDAEDERLNGLLAPKSDIVEPHDWRNWLWLVRFGLMVPLPALISFEILLWNSLPALGQTITDGTPAVIVYLMVSFWSLVAFVNTIPFLLRIPFRSTVVFLFPVFVASIIAVCSPAMNEFTALAPFKTFFRSSYDLDTQNSTAYVYGAFPYVDRVLELVPSARQNGFTCETFLAKAGRICQYPVSKPILPDGEVDWFTVSSSIEDDTEEDSILANIQINTNTTRICYLEFDRYKPPEIAGIGGVRWYGNGSDQKNGCTVLRLFKRTWWEEPFSVLLKFKRDGPRNITVSCGYDEWSPDGGVGVVRSLDEIWHNIPSWVGVSKFTTGLLRVSKSHKVF